MIDKLGYVNKPPTLTDVENVKKESAPAPKGTPEKVEVSHTMQQKQLAESKSSELAAFGSIQQRIIGTKLEQYVLPLQSIHPKSEIAQAEAQDAEARLAHAQAQTSHALEEARGDGSSIESGHNVGRFQQQATQLQEQFVDYKPPVANSLIGGAAGNSSLQQLHQKLEDLNTRKQEILAKLKELETKLEGLKYEGSNSSGFDILDTILKTDGKQSEIEQLQSEIATLKTQLADINKEIIQTLEDMQKNSTDNSPEQITSPMTGGEYRKDVQKTLDDFDESSAAVKRSNLLK